MLTGFLTCVGIIWCHVVCAVVLIHLFKVAPLIEEFDQEELNCVQSSNVDDHRDDRRSDDFRVADQRELGREPGRRTERRRADSVCSRGDRRASFRRGNHHDRGLSVSE